jgi:hypothetical protein
VSLPELVRTALLGTARQPAPSPAAPAELAELLDAPAAGAEAALLRRAAVLALYRAAGARPATVGALPAPAPLETGRPCPAAAADHLRAILDGMHPSVLAEWLRAAAGAGVLAPPEHLPELLERADGDADLAELVEPLLGARGRWVADAQGFEWAASGEPAERWSLGSPFARRHLLRTLRATHPAAGRELLAGTWEEETARDREAFVAELRGGLSLDDEAFLERALDARQEGVRAQAAELLSAVPGSRLGGRMADRVRALVESGRREIRVKLPDATLTDELRRDGVTDRPPPGMGRGAWILWQLVAAAPLRTWTCLVGGDPATVLDRRVADGMRELVVGAWIVAAARQRDQAWAGTLLARVGGAAGPEVRPLLALDREAGERYVAARLGETATAWRPEDMPGPWSPAFSAVVLEHALGAHGTARALRALGRLGDPVRAARVVGAAADSPDSPAARAAPAAAAMLAFRATMLDSFKETRR